MRELAFLSSRIKLSRMTLVEEAKAFVMSEGVARTYGLARALAAPVGLFLGIDRLLADYVHEFDVMGHRACAHSIKLARLICAIVFLVAWSCADVNYFVAQSKVVDTIAKLWWQSQERRVTVVSRLALPNVSHAQSH